MKLEEALSLLRNGNKITHPLFDVHSDLPDIYLELCNHCLPDENGKLEIIGQGIILMKDGKMYDSQADYSKIDVSVPRKYVGTNIAFPALDFLLIFSDQWEIYQEPQDDNI